ncbi:MAG TPA: sigma-70 family RNA polymerase sigma factor [Steroidobacteraceae bacterium]|nr:sigma-70 family RNA polymerase sigma factor [Steroidobacteraceae bacterium]
MSLQATNPVSDTLLLQARAGDRLAFAELVRQHQGSVFSIGLRMLNRRDQAEDLAQDVFLQLFRKLDSIESFDHLGFWLRRVAANLAIDWLRRLPYSATQPLEPGVDVAVEDPDSDPLMSRELARLLGELPPHPRAVMLLRYQEDRDVTEIAAALDMPVNTVKSHIKRSLTALRGRMIGAKLIDCEEMQ